MFDFTSRYARSEKAIYTAADGRQIAYVRRRFLPPGESLPLLAEITVEPRERLDLLANRTLGDPLQFWRIADANAVLRPDELTEEPGRRIRVTLPRR